MRNECVFERPWAPDGLEITIVDHLVGPLRISLAGYCHHPRRDIDSGGHKPQFLKVPGRAACAATEIHDATAGHLPLQQTGQVSKDEIISASQPQFVIGGGNFTPYQPIMWSIFAVAARETAVLIMRLALERDDACPISRCVLTSCRPQPDPPASPVSVQARWST